MSERKPMTEARKEQRRKYSREYMRYVYWINPEKSRARRKAHPNPTRPEPLNCEICERRPSTNKLAIDHCHTTGAFRGWLCFRCNTALGKLGDNIEGLEKAVAYMRRFLEAQKDALPLPSPVVSRGIQRRRWK